MLVFRGNWGITDIFFQKAIAPNSIEFRFPQISPNSSRKTEFPAFQSLHGISYRSFFHDFNRRKIFEHNLQKIQQHNALYEQGIKSYKLGITPFADLTIEEFMALLTLKHDASPARNGRSLFKVSISDTDFAFNIFWP